MKVFVFHSSNEFIGKFDINSVTEIHSEFARFAEKHQVSAQDYLESEDSTWTVVDANGQLSLHEGRITPPTDSPKPQSGALPLSQVLQSKYRDHRRVGSAANTFASFIMVAGWILGTLIALYGFYITFAANLPGQSSLLLLLPWLFIASAVALTLHFFGLLLITLARLLETSLDTSINTSTHLNKEQKAKALGSEN